MNPTPPPPPTPQSQPVPPPPELLGQGVTVDVSLQLRGIFSLLRDARVHHQAIEFINEIDPIDPNLSQHLFALHRIQNELEARIWRILRDPPRLPRPPNLNYDITQTYY
jgi:hypothetical protein